MMRTVYLFMIILVFTTSCKKSSVSDCFNSTGPLTTIERPITGFHTLILKDNINLVLVSSNTNYLTIEAGNNLLPKIITEVSDSVLTIQNNNSCNWVRNYNSPITAYLNFTKLDTIEYRSIGNINSTDTVHIENLMINVTEGAGEISFIVNASVLHCNIHYGTADIKMKGKSNVCYIYSASFGLINNLELSTDFVYLNNRSSNDVYVKANKVLGVTIENIGNVFYKGNPYDISLNQTGTGQLIKLED